MHVDIVAVCISAVAVHNECDVRECGGGKMDEWDVVVYDERKDGEVDVVYVGEYWVGCMEYVVEEGGHEVVE